LQRCELGSQVGGYSRGAGVLWADVGHHRLDLGGELSVGFDPVLEGEAGAADVGHSEAHRYPIVQGDLAAVVDLQPKDDERDLGAAAELLTPQLGACGLHIGDDRRVVDVGQRINVAPANLDRHLEDIVFHIRKPSTGATIKTMTDIRPAEREVELWWISCTSTEPFLGAMTGLLDAGERQRANRFRVAEARERFVVAHALIRELLGRAAGLPPASLAFAEGARGKPRLIGTGSAIADAPSFNLAHSGDTAVVALASSEVGVDVESIRPVPNLDRLARRFCSTHEQDWLIDRSPLEREADFLALWTCKEAYLKAMGAGVAMPLREVEVEPEVPRLRTIAGDPNTAAEWTLLRADLPEPAVCTVAVRGHGWRLIVKEFHWTGTSQPG